MARTKEIVVHQKVMVCSKNLIQISSPMWNISLVVCIYKGKCALHKYYIKMEFDPRWKLLENISKFLFNTHSFW